MIRASSSLISHLSQHSKFSRSLLSNPHLLLNPSHSYSSSFNTIADQEGVNPIDGSRIKPSRRQEDRAVRQLTLSGNSAACSGRNNQGRITTFHRGGGSKRLKRKIDLKRSTSSMGIVERIEYDPNRSSRIALVRWIELNHHQKGSKPKTTVQEMPALSPPPPPPKIVLESTVLGPFSFSSMPAAGKKGVDQKRKKIGSMAAAVNGNVVVVGGSLVTPDGSKGPSRKLLTSAKDVFLSALSKGSSSSFGFPRMAVAGSKPGFFAPRMREGKLKEETTTFSLGEIRKWRAKTLTGSLRWPQRV